VNQRDAELVTAFLLGNLEMEVPITLRVVGAVPEGQLDYRPDHAALRNAHPNVIYLNNNTPSTLHVPPHLQRCMVYEYCQKHELRYGFELFELETMDHLPTLLHIVGELGCNAILYSIYSLPVSPHYRRHIYAAARSKGVHLYFVNEDMALAEDGDEARIEQFLEFAKYGEPNGAAPH
jgi:sporadic carbohydrate cluster protein (TIGR04323 family)